MARPREHDDATRAALLDAAGRALREEGPRALSLRRIAQDVGTSTQAIYTLFGSKQGLVRAMYRHGFENLARHLAAVHLSEDPVGDLVQLALAYRASALEQPHLYDIMFACPIPEFEPDEHDQELALSTLAKLETLLVRHAEAGTLPGRDPDALTIQLWALAHGLASLELQGTLGPSDEAEQHWREAFEAAARGIRMNPASATA